MWLKCDYERIAIKNIRFAGTGSVWSEILDRRGRPPPTVWNKASVACDWKVQDHCVRFNLFRFNTHACKWIVRPWRHMTIVIVIRLMSVSAWHATDSSKHLQWWFGRETQLSAAFAIRMSVRLSLRPSLYRFLRPNFAILNLGFHPERVR